MRAGLKHLFSPSGPTSLTDAGALLKYVLRPGVLQDQAGPSIATEFGVLLPDSIGDTGFGARISGIVSQRWDWGTVHLNVSGELTRDQHADVFTGIIIEGPFRWTVRPVAEIFYEEEFGQARTISGLIGAIWQVRDDFSFDVGFRHAIVNGANVNEVRAGFTVGFPIRFFGRTKSSYDEFAITRRGPSGAYRESLAASRDTKRTLQEKARQLRHENKRISKLVLRPTAVPVLVQPCEMSFR